MNEARTRDLFRAAIEVLVTRKVTTRNPDDPEAYKGTVRADLLTRYRSEVRAILRDLDDDDEIEAETLANMLEPVAASTTAEPRPPELPTVTADGWEPLDPTERSRARTRLEAIRTALKETP